MSGGTWISKTWGEFQHLTYLENGKFPEDLNRKDLLKINAGSCSSLHYHDTWNQFILVSGCIKIISSIGGEVAGVTMLPGNFYTVPAFVPHQFQSIDDSVVVEIYGKHFPQIVRFSTGQSNAEVVFLEGYRVVR